MVEIDIDEAIRHSWERVRRLEYLTRRQSSLAEEVADLEVQLSGLRARLRDEERDVARLTGMSFAALLASLSGDKDDQLLRERVEAEAVRLRVKGHEGRLEQMRAQLKDVLAELGELRDARSAYESALARRPGPAEAGSYASPDLADLGRRLASVEADLWEHGEARAAGANAIQSLRAVSVTLRGASGVASAEMSGRTFAELVRHGQLGQADRAAWYAQQALADFSRQLADIGVETRFEMPPVDIRWFADMFFDDLITDATRHHRITRSASHIEEISRWAAGMVEHLSVRCGQLSQTVAHLRRQWEAVLHGEKSAGGEAS
ncbi:hypothetical protein [Actinopolymorpha alba]|uniref:hypothetical protein n=1 Tax=Actinopolymorpha alba TaxID=533267 RepID=UPI000361C858|nr:hypothetical protein [Actinopolymorpha alba]